MRRLRRAHQRHARERIKFKKRVLTAGTAAAITLAAGINLSKAVAHMSDPHELPVSQDADEDLLANREELAIGYRVFNPDQNRNEIPDGVGLAKRCAAVINELPQYKEGIIETYRVEHPCFGIEICDICGKELNMCWVEINNLQLGLSINVPYLSLHYMEHGSFSDSGEEYGAGRINVARLLRVLELRIPYDPNEHQLSLDPNDLDGDLLTDSEELEAGYNLYDPDQNQNLIPDGIELAKRCAAIIEGLPEYEGGIIETYRVDYPCDGIAFCDICGETVNMCHVEIVNPQLGLSIDVPYLSLHYMSHGSFDYAGDVHGVGRIEVALLLKVIEMPRRCGDLGTIYLPSDLNEDCRVDVRDFGQLANRWLQSTDPNDNSSTEY
jgi:hypothetical protein